MTVKRRLREALGREPTQAELATTIDLMGWCSHTVGEAAEQIQRSYRPAGDRLTLPGKRTSSRQAKRGRGRGTRVTGVYR